MRTSGNGRPLSLTTLPLMVPGFETRAGEVCAIAGSQQSNTVAKTLAELKSLLWEIIGCEGSRLRFHNQRYFSHRIVTDDHLL